MRQCNIVAGKQEEGDVGSALYDSFAYGSSMWYRQRTLESDHEADKREGDNGNG